MVNGVSMDFCAQKNPLGEVELQTVRCRRCRTPLGWSTPQALVLAGGIVLQRTTIFCPVCRKARTWRPMAVSQKGD
jgi:endogenous inhibitor of DNA gyrase (YacG/DUF329 family)